MSAPRVLRTALGISVGDIVRTSYSTGPYEVWSICGPRYTSGFVGVLVLRTWQVISLTLVTPGVTSPREVHGENGFSYINGIRREGDRWFTDQNHEVFVEPDSLRGQLAFDLFAQPEEAPYEFQPGVDYAHHAWKCRRCGVDFNAKPESRWGPAWHCGAVATQLLLMEPRPTPPAPAWSDSQVAAGFRGAPALPGS